MVTTHLRQVHRYVPVRRTGAEHRLSRSTFWSRLPGEQGMALRIIRFDSTELQRPDEHTMDRADAWTTYARQRGSSAGTSRQRRRYSAECRATEYAVHLSKHRQPVQARVAEANGCVLRRV